MSLCYFSVSPLNSSTSARNVSASLLIVPSQHPFSASTFSVSASIFMTLMQRLPQVCHVLFPGSGPRTWLSPVYLSLHLKSLVIACWSSAYPRSQPALVWIAPSTCIRLQSSHRNRNIPSAWPISPTQVLEIPWSATWTRTHIGSESDSTPLHSRTHQCWTRN